MQSEFRAAMAKLAVVGQDTSEMVDCSEVIPEPQPFNGPAVLPPSLTHNDIEQAVSIQLLMLRGILLSLSFQCATAAFPTLSTLPGPATVIPPV